MQRKGDTTKILAEDDFVSMWWRFWLGLLYDDHLFEESEYMLMLKQLGNPLFVILLYMSTIDISREYLQT